MEEKIIAKMGVITILILALMGIVWPIIIFTRAEFLSIRLQESEQRLKTVTQEATVANQKLSELTKQANQVIINGTQTVLSTGNQQLVSAFRQLGYPVDLVQQELVKQRQQTTQNQE